MVARPLLGTVIGITADRRADEQALLFERAGAKVLHGPSIRTLPLGDDPDLEATTAELIRSPPDVVLLTTGIGTRGWFSSAAASGVDEDLRHALAGAAVLARGPKAAGAAVSHGLAITVQAESEQSSELVAVVRDRFPTGVRVAVQLDGSTRTDVRDALRSIGAEVVEVRVYRWTQPVATDPARQLIEAAAERRLDAITFTSSPALENLLELAERLDAADIVRNALNDQVVTACVGPLCAATARSLGIEPAVVPDRSRLGAMVEAVVQHLGNPQPLRFGTEDVVLRQSSIVAGDAVVELSVRERAVLEVLAARPGAVISRDTLRRVAWPGGRADDHTIGVTVARLRRRLGPLGEAVETSPRRGYRLAVTAVAV